MAYIIETPNPFKPLTDIKRHTVQPGQTISQWLSFRFAGFVEFETPTICVVNGAGLLRKDWPTYTIQPNDVINFVAVPGTVPLLIISIVLALASVAVTLFLGTPQPETPGEQPASDPVFTSKGQANAIRISEPIECPYGRNRIYPSYASRPYFQYEGNDQFQYSLFCIGQGFYEIETVQIGDTDINLFQEVEYEVVEPGDDVTLFPTNVYTAPEAGGQELFAPNDDDYSGDGYVGPFAAAPSGSQSNAIQIDLVFPKGLYYSNNDGGLSSQTVIVQAQAREIDDDGLPLTLFADIFGGPITVTGRTTTPQRRTYSQPTSPARYEVRVRRTNTRQDGHRFGNQVEWEGLRSFILDDQAFGDVTLLAVKIRATNNLNERTQQRFNVVCTRKLQMHQSDGFTTPYVATRSIVWALVDVFRAQYGARITEDRFYDWDMLYELEALYEERNEHFDWIFRDPITVWEAARVIARAGRAIPLIVGSLISMKRDGQLDTPVAMFGKENIIEGSFSWDVKLWDLDEYDSARVSYIEPDAGYKEVPVVATLPGGDTDTPEDIRLPGVQDRDHAYHEGLYIRAVRTYQRENISFSTGMEGYIPTFGDLIIVAHDVPRWAANGYVVHGESESNGDFHLWLSEPVEFESNETSVVMLRNHLGEVLGPYEAFETEDPKQIRITVTGILIDFLETGTTEPMLFIFGTSGQINKYCRVVKVEPQDREIMRITAVNEDSRVHSFDGLSAPSFQNEDSVPVTPDLPEVMNLELTQLNTSVLSVLASWSAAFGADYYIVQYSQDGENWDNVGTTDRTSLEWQVRPGTLYVRVAGVGIGQGPWAEAVVSIGNLAGLDLIDDFDNDIDWTIEWLELLNAESYDVRVYDNSSPTFPVLKRTTNILSTADRTFTYDLDDALADGNVNRHMLVSVTPKFSDADGTATELEIDNPIPSPPTALSVLATPQDSDATDMEYKLTWSNPAEEDLICISVWLEPVSGFDPEVATPYLHECDSAVGFAGLIEELIVSVPLDSFGEHGPYFWRVACFDVWGQEISTNVSEEGEIPATSGWVP